MNQVWDKTLEGLAKVNNWIPLWAVLIAGIALVGVSLILAICGCVLRRNLVPNWLIWTYFTFATVVIFAHVGNDVAAWVAAMEVPVIAVLLCYIFRVLIRRRPRYTYVEKTVYARELAKGRVVKANDEQPVADKAEDQDAREIAPETKEDETEQELEDNRENALREAQKAEREAEAAKLVAAEKAAREAREKERAEEKAAAEKAAREALKEPVRPATPNIAMPSVKPFTPKTYEPTHEPTIVATPVSQTVPGLRTSTTPVRPTTTSSFSRPTPSFGTSTPRPTTSSFGRPTTGTTTNSTTPRSTEDIMAAIERLRASMKK